MNTSAFKTGVEHGGPIALSAGVAALTVALVGISHGNPVAAGPVPAVTATVTASPAPEARRTVVAAPPVSTRTAVRFPATAAGRTGGERVSASRPPAGAPAPSGPKPTPSGGGSPVLLSAHLPLIDLTVGGHR